MYDEASSTPTVLPDGSVLFGCGSIITTTAAGIFFTSMPQGNYLNAYTFGWDSTAGVYQHDGTYSVVIKDNHYAGPAYCYFNNPVCTRSAARTVLRFTAECQSAGGVVLPKHDHRSESPERVRVVCQCTGDRRQRAGLRHQRRWKHLLRSAGSPRRLYPMATETLSERSFRRGLHSAFDWRGRKSVQPE